MGGKRAELFHAALEPSRRREHKRPAGCRTRDPEGVRNTSGTVDRGSGASTDAPISHLELELALQNVEGFVLMRMHVRGHETCGPHEELSGDPTWRPLAKNDALPRHRIGDCVYALLDHLI